MTLEFKFPDLAASQPVHMSGQRVRMIKIIASRPLDRFDWPLATVQQSLRPLAGHILMHA